MIGGLLERNPRLAQWIWGFKAPERGTIILVHRRVYILPTRLGWLFAATLLVLLVGSINYALALGFALTFLLAGERRHSSGSTSTAARDTTVPRSSRAMSARARSS